MSLTLRSLTFVTLSGLAFAAPAVSAQDAMAPAVSAMAPMAGDADVTQCLEQVAGITFAEVKQAASEACRNLHNNAMGSDAMAPADTMAPAMDAMAPKP